MAAKGLDRERFTTTWQAARLGRGRTPGDDPRRRYYRLSTTGSQVLSAEVDRLKEIVRAASAALAVAGPAGDGRAGSPSPGSWALHPPGFRRRFGGELLAILASRRRHAGLLQTRAAQTRLVRAGPGGSARPSGDAPSRGDLSSDCSSPTFRLRAIQCRFEGRSRQNSRL